MASSTVTDHPLMYGQAPTWASEWGQDEHGPFVVLKIGAARQMLRWIPPGQFMMGSEAPDPDWDWTKNEVPRHWVTITRGFWMFDTPVTQEFWEAVMGENPSEFKGKRRPVEKVSWHDCQLFLERVQEQVAEVRLQLPTEAQWEYSCRAGTGEERYGDLKEIGWYRDNSGRESGKRETHEVKQLKPNGWGLYDTLGNVWEWCQDASFRTYEDAVTDPLFEGDSGSARRVIRGGSWSRNAEVVRAASRSAYHAESRYYFLGFRCAVLAEPSQ